MHKITVKYSTLGTAFPDAACRLYWRVEATLILFAKIRGARHESVLETSTENIIAALRASVATGEIDASEVEILLVDTTTPGGDTLCQIDKEGRMHPCGVPAVSLYKECLDAILYRGEK